MHSDGMDLTPAARLLTPAARLLAAAVVAAALALAGCGKPTGSSDNSGGAGNGGAGKTADANHLTVGASFWHSGFKVTLGDARIVAAGGGALTPSGDRALAVAATFQNLGGLTTHFAAEMVVASGGQFYTEAAEAQKLPELPGKASSPGVIAFVVDPAFRLADAVLTVGASGQRQAVVPLSHPRDAVTLEPRPVVVTGKAHASTVFYATVTGGQVRADNPESYDEAAAGHEFLRLSYSATNEGPGVLDILYGFLNHLVLADGSTVSAAVGCGNPQLDPGPHGHADGGVSCFELPSPISGKFTYSISDDNSQGLTFTVP